MFETKQWAYHVTLAQFLPSIKAKGLVATEHAHANGQAVIFVEPDEEEVSMYEEPDTATLRFPVDGFGCLENGECVVDGPVPADSIEVRVGNQWERL